MTTITQHGRPGDPIELDPFQTVVKIHWPVGRNVLTVNAGTSSRQNTYGMDVAATITGISDSPNYRAQELTVTLGSVASKEWKDRLIWNYQMKQTAIDYLDDGIEFQKSYETNLWAFNIDKIVKQLTSGDTPPKTLHARIALTGTIGKQEENISGGFYFGGLHFPNNGREIWDYLVTFSGESIAEVDAKMRAAFPGTYPFGAVDGKPMYPNALIIPIDYNVPGDPGSGISNGERFAGSLFYTPPSTSEYYDEFDAQFQVKTYRKIKNLKVDLKPYDIDTNPSKGEHYEDESTDNKEPVEDRAFTFYRGVSDIVYGGKSPDVDYEITFDIDVATMTISNENEEGT